MSNEEIIANFLKPPGEGGGYTDERLTMLLAHTQDGKLSFWSCCCFAGIPSAVHALRGKMETITQSFRDGHSSGGASDPLWVAMSGEFCGLAREDAERRAKLIPLILAEMKRREALKPEVGFINNDTEAQAGVLAEIGI